VNSCHFAPDRQRAKARQPEDGIVHVHEWNADEYDVWLDERIWDFVVSLPR